MASPDERRVRRNLAKVGLKLVKSRRRAELSIDDRGKYSVVRRSNGRFICSGDFSLSLEEARACIVLARKGEFDPHSLDTRRRPPRQASYVDPDIETPWWGSGWQT
jgi:hypothetical protein